MVQIDIWIRCLLAWNLFGDGNGDSEMSSSQIRHKQAEKDEERSFAMVVEKVGNEIGRSERR